MKKLVLSLVCVFALGSLTVFAQKADCGDKKVAKTGEASIVKAAYNQTMETKDIVDTAVGAGMFKTLVAAVQAAGLVDTLKGTGPFTVFAPTDEAFAKLPEGTIATLLKPENKDMLVKILTYHVVAGKVKAADVVKLTSAKTVQGQEVTVKAKDGKVMINSSNVVKTDIEATNGVIHVIDTVLMPK
jgi:uncharacterized surface protein with fasciclin (FAS1) repeats